MLSSNSVPFKSLLVLCLLMPLGCSALPYVEKFTSKLTVNSLPKNSYQAHVVKVVDGDTIHVKLKSNQIERIRLNQIDTPEKGQPYGREATIALREWVLDKFVTVIPKEKDKYGRIVADIQVGSINISREMIRGGFAWAYRKYLTDKSLIAVEEEAKIGKRGLWGLSGVQRIPPWEWRRGRRGQKTTRITNRKTDLEPVIYKNVDFECARQRSCSEVKSCAEAYYYLVVCKNKVVDEDQNGIPCEAICKQ